MTKERKEEIVIEFLSFPFHFLYFHSMQVISQHLQPQRVNCCHVDHYELLLIGDRPVRPSRSSLFYGSATRPCPDLVPPPFLSGT